MRESSTELGKERDLEWSNDLHLRTPEKVYITLRDVYKNFFFITVFKSKRGIYFKCQQEGNKLINYDIAIHSWNIV